MGSNGVELASLRAFGPEIIIKKELAAFSMMIYGSDRLR
jgi:hypothetical protein